MIILLNGPPRSGKDTAAEIIRRNILGRHRVKHMKLSKPLKEGIREIFGFSATEIEQLEKMKDDPLSKEFGGLTYRQMQIELFHHLEAFYGPEILGTCFLREWRGVATKHAVISDTGRTAETTPIIESGPYGQVGLIQLSRKGCSFNGDIREYVDPKGIKHVAKIDNKYDLELFEAQLKKVLREWGILEDD